MRVNERAGGDISFGGSARKTPTLETVVGPTRSLGKEVIQPQLPQPPALSDLSITAA